MASDSDCQSKMVCEIYQNKSLLGQIGARAQHGLDYLEVVQYFNLPSELLNAVDEYQVSWKKTALGRMLQHTISFKGVNIPIVTFMATIVAWDERKKVYN